MIILIKSVFYIRQSTGNESTDLDRRRLPILTVSFNKIRKKILVTRFDVDDKAMSFQHQNGIR